MAAQWGQGQQGFQYPMQTGFPGNPQLQQNPQFQPQNPQFQPQNPQFQPQQQFQSGGLGPPTPGGMLPQQTGFPGQRPMGMQQTGFPSGPAFLHSQPTGFIGGGNVQQNRPPPPPVPPIPSQFSQPNQGGNFLNFPPPQQPNNNNLLGASSGFGGGGLVPQTTGYPRPLMAQPTGMVDPRLHMMSQTFMPMNTSAPYGAGGVPQLPQQQQTLVSSMAQHNQEHRGAPTQQLSWALTTAEKKKYNDIFRSWDAQNTKFIDGSTALNVFGASGLPKDELAHIWALADIDDRGKLNIAEFHVAMGLIYRRLNGMPVPDQLPAELVPPSSRDLDKSVDLVKELLKHETRSRSPSSLDAPISRLKTRSFNSSSPSLDANRDATIYKHSDSEPPGGFYKPRSRHVDRDAIRSRDDDDSPSADLSDMKRQLANTANRLDRAAQAEASRTKEDEELDQEMDDLKYRVKRVQDDLDYNARPPRTSSKEEERRRLERELLSLMHERIPEVERKIKAREERKEKEKRQWARDRDRANDRHGRYDDRDDYSRRNDDRDRPYSRGDDRDGSYSRRAYDRDDGDRDRDWYRRDRSLSRERNRERDYERPRSSVGRSPPPPAPASAASSTPPIIQAPKPAPSPKPRKNMTPAERQAFIKAEGQRLTQARMAALGLAVPASSPVIDTSVEDRLQQEKKEAEEKAKAAEKQAEERERARKERLENERSLKEGSTTPAPPTVPAAAPKAIPKAAPALPKSRPPAPPPPRKAPPVSPVVAPPPAPKPPVPVVPTEPEVDHEQELRAREAELRKKREERDAQFQAKLRLLEAEEEEAARREEERYQARLLALKARTVRAPTPPVEQTPPLAPRTPTPVVQPPPAVRPPSPPPAPVPSTPAPVLPKSAPAVPPIPSPAEEKSTNPFNHLIKSGKLPSTPPAANGGTSFWPRSQTAPPPSADLAPKSPVPNTVKTNYNTAPSSIDDDWDEINENDGSDDSSDDEITQSRTARANIAEQLFGSMLPRPASAAASAPPTAPPAPPLPPPAPAAPPAPTAPTTPAAPPSSNDVSALMLSIQGGKKLRPAKTVDRSAPPVSGRVLGDVAPPPHISLSVRSASPPPTVQPRVPEAVPMVNDNTNNRQSVGWFADRAADVGATPVEIHRLPSTMEDDEEDIYQRSPATDIPEILVDGPTVEPVSDLMADVDKSIQHRVRSLYAFEGDGPEDLSFGENLIIIANPSKTGGDWWYGTVISSSKSGLFPKTYVEVVEPRKAKAIYAYSSDNSDELTFAEGDILSIVDTSEEEWWKAEQGGVVFIVPAAYLEVVEG